MRTYHLAAISSPDARKKRSKRGEGKKFRNHGKNLPLLKNILQRLCSNVVKLTSQG